MPNHNGCNSSLRPTHSFYITTLFGHFVEIQKAAGLQRLKERREQERIKREEEERIRQAELNLQNQIRSLKHLFYKNSKKLAR